MQQEEEGIWHEGPVIFVRGRTGQATSLLLSFFALGFALLLLIWILMVNQLALAPAGQEWMLGDSYAHMAGWAVTILVIAFLSVLLVRLLVFRRALAWRTVAIQVREDGVHIDGHLLPFKAFDAMTMERSVSLSSRLMWRVGLFALLFVPMDWLARQVFGRPFPVTFAPVPHEVYWVKFGQVPLRLYNSDPAIPQRLRLMLLQDVCEARLRAEARAVRPEII